MVTAMAADDDDNMVDCDDAMGHDDGNGATVDINDDGNDGDDNNDDGDINGTMGNGATGYDDNDDGGGLRRRRRKDHGCL